MFINRVIASPQIDLLNILHSLKIPVQLATDLTDNEKQLAAFNLDNQTDLSKCNFYKIPFYYAPSLIERRQFYMNKGEVYITHQKLTSLLEIGFRDVMNKNLQKIFKNKKLLQADTRIAIVIDKLAKMKEVNSLTAGKQFDIEEGSTTSAEVEKHNVLLPPCMMLLHRKIKETGHAKHHMRLQFSLFLKGIGLTLEDSLKYWQELFSKKTTAADFQKNYSYNIRHSYGLEGKRVNYTPYSCSKLQNDMPPPQSSNEFQGCPFKILNEENLVNFLQKSYNLQVSQVEEIRMKKKNNEFSLACIKLYEANFKNNEFTGSNPVHYFKNAKKVVISYENNN